MTSYQSSPSASRRIAGSYIFAHHREATATEPRDTIGELEVCNALFLFDMQAPWARYAPINITWDQLEHQNGARKRSFDEQPYQLDIKSARLVNNCFIQTIFIAYQQGVNQVPPSLSCDFHGSRKLPGSSHHQYPCMLVHCRMS